MLLILVSWVIFAFEDLNKVKEYIFTMFKLNNMPIINSEAIYYLQNYLIIIVIGIICSVPIINIIKRKMHNLKNIVNKKSYKKVEENKKLKIVYSSIISIGLVFIVVISTSSLVNNSFNPFLYFRF